MAVAGEEVADKKLYLWAQVVERQWGVEFELGGLSEQSTKGGSLDFHYQTQSPYLQHP